MLHVLTPASVGNAEALRITSVPRSVLWRGLSLLPLRRYGSPLFWRLMFDQSLPRYLVALLPFPAAMAARPDLALPIAQAPLAMFALIYVVENNVLAVPDKKKRQALMDQADAARALDRLQLRGHDILTRIAAGRGLNSGRLNLVVEQSPLARVAPLTVVSVQCEDPRPHVLPLEPGEVALIAARLFDAPEAEEDAAPAARDGGLTEAALHLANLSQNTFLRSVPLEPASISAHARLRAMAAAG